MLPPEQHRHSPRGPLTERAPSTIGRVLRDIPIQSIDREKKHP